MGITDQKSRFATEADIKAPWSGGKDGKFFRCKLCGYKFKAGDYYRFVFGKEYTNIIVCKTCDTPNVLDKWIKAHKNWEEMKVTGPFWWFITQLEEALAGSEREASYETSLLRDDIEFWKEKAQSYREY